MIRLTLGAISTLLDGDAAAVHEVASVVDEDVAADAQVLAVFGMERGHQGERLIHRAAERTYASAGLTATKRNSAWSVARCSRTRTPSTKLRSYVSTFCDSSGRARQGNRCSGRLLYWRFLFAPQLLPLMVP